MIYQFGPFELDIASVELRNGESRVNIEPQVFAVLALLIENRDRMVTKEELIEKVWDGRIVSDAALASRVKSARQALGDDGKSQHFIRTIHGRGFRFVADARVSRGGAAAQRGRANHSHSTDTKSAAFQLPLAERILKPSLAVLPFRLIGDGGRYASLAVALPDELITELSRLRWLFISARGSSFRLRNPETEFSEIGAVLGVRYCLWGTVEVSDKRIVVGVELVDTIDGGVVWADRFSGAIDDVHAIREEIRSRVLVALELQIPIHEASIALHAAPGNLDAWSAYHLGLQHLYRFNRLDNVAAEALFQQSISLDPYFARAHAGLSFIHFQTAFMRYSDNIGEHVVEARRFAERAVELDPLDPFVNFTMGRTYWLEGDLDRSLGWFERSTTICPHFAQGIYAQAWTESLATRAAEARIHIDLAIRLSPLDPLHYAMLATRAFTHIGVGEDIEAARWADRAARSPGAHVLIAMIAAAVHALGGNTTHAEFWAQNVRARNGNLTRADFARSFPMKSEDMRARVQRALAHLGF
jgi:TolB-like protein